MDEIMEANDFVEWFGIFPEAIKNVNDQITQFLEKENIEFEWMFQQVVKKLEEKGNWHNITKSIAMVLCEIAKEQILEKHPSAKVNYNISQYTDGSVDINFNLKYFA